MEIIELFCNDFSFDFDFNSIFLEDPVHNHLTAPSSFIYAISSIFIVDKQPDGYWKWKSETDPIPLCTRYQGQNCIIHKSNESCCIESISLENFSPYKFK